MIKRLVFLLVIGTLLSNLVSPNVVVSNKEAEAPQINTNQNLEYNQQVKNNPSYTNGVVPNNNGIANIPNQDILLNMIATKVIGSNESQNNQIASPTISPTLQDMISSVYTITAPYIRSLGELLINISNY
jgi:hypothetical protein